MEIALFERLKEAYGTSTLADNRFAKALNSIKWDTTFYADGEHYFMKDGFTLMVENLNPFEEEWKPSVMFSDRSMATF